MALAREYVPILSGAEVMVDSTPPNRRYGTRSSTARQQQTFISPNSSHVGDVNAIHEDTFSASGSVGSSPATGAERRGSEYLLMAAEAYAEAERTSDHAPTVFQAAFDIATAGSAGSPPAAPAKFSAAKAKTPRKSASRHRSTKVRPPPVKHEYHDWSTFAGYDNVILSDRKHKAGGVTQPFPDKLMTMLDAESVARPEVISWCSHGRAFICKQPKVFTDEVMGKYFKQSKLTSFQRQLNLYGFRRITRGPDASAYYHELFLRGRPVLCMRMVRTAQPSIIRSSLHQSCVPTFISRYGKRSRARGISSQSITARSRTSTQWRQLSQGRQVSNMILILSRTL